jgi:O-antigen ligase
VIARRTSAIRRGGSWLRTLLIVVLATLYPFHHVLGGLNVNVSMGDGVVVLVTVLVVFQFAAGAVPLPRYALQASALFVAIVASLTVNAFVPSPFFSLRDAQIEAVKFLGVASWMIAVFWLVCDDFPRRFVQWATTALVVATGWATWTVVENVVLHVASRPSGPFDNPNLYANYLALNVFLALALSSLEREHWTGVSHHPRTAARIQMILRVGVLPLLILGLLSTGSRGGLLGFLVGVAIAVRWRVPALTLRRALAFGVSAVILGGALGWFFSHHPFLVNRVEAVSINDPNVTSRFALWSAARHAFYGHPVFGIGYGEFPDYAAREAGLGHLAAVSHQTYLSAAAELGVLGLGSLLWLLLSVMRDSWRVSARSGSLVPRALGGFVTATAVQGLFNNVDQFRSLWIVFGLAAAAIGYCTGMVRASAPERRFETGRGALRVNAGSLS